VEDVAASGEDACCFEQNALAFGGDEAADAEYLHGNGDAARLARGEEAGVHTKAGDVQARPVLGRGDAHELSAAVAGDADGEGGLLDLLAEQKLLLVKELFRPVDGERVGDLCGTGGDAAYGGDGSAEVDVEMAQIAGAEPVGEDHGFGEVAEGIADAIGVDAGAGEGGGESAEEDQGFREEGFEGNAECAQCAGLPDVEGAGCGCGLVVAERAPVAGVVDGGGLKGEAESAQAGDLIQKEGMRDGWVLTEQIGQAGCGCRRIFWGSAIHASAICSGDEISLGYVPGELKCCFHCGV